MVKRGMLRDFKAMVAAEGYWDENKFNKTESTYEYPNGTIVEFFSCDNAGKVHGPARDILFVNGLEYHVKSLGNLISVPVKRSSSTTTPCVSSGAKPSS